MAKSRDLARSSRSGVPPAAFALPGPFHLDASTQPKVENVGGTVIDLDHERKDVADVESNTVTINDFATFTLGLRKGMTVTK